MCKYTALACIKTKISIAEEWKPLKSLKSLWTHVQPFCLQTVTDRMQTYKNRNGPIFNLC